MSSVCLGSYYLGFETGAVGCLLRASHQDVLTILATESWRIRSLEKICIGTYTQL